MSQWNQLDNQRAQNNLINAQMKLAQMKANTPGYGMVGATQLIKTPQGYARYNKMTGKLDYLTDASGKPVMPLTRNGLSMRLPNGTIVSMGGYGNSQVAVNPFSGSRYGGGKNFYIKNKDDTYTGFSGPTTGFQTAQQKRDAAQAEGSKIIDQVNQGISPYRGPIGDIRLIHDIWKSYTGSPEEKKESRNKLAQYQAARSMENESAMISARMGGANQIGSELTKDQKNQLFPGQPYNFLSSFIPGSVLTNSTQNARKILGLGVDATNEEALNSFPYHMPSPPVFMGNSNYPVSKYQAVKEYGPINLSKQTESPKQKTAKKSDRLGIR